jgi:UDP-GlcNAc:undecaprenyl-phosphate GlcNAc-1-phosphate transferase
MITGLLLFATALLISYLLTPRIRDSARRNDLLDHGSARKVHTKPIPRLGGVALAIGFFLPVGWLLALRPEVLPRPDLALAGGALLAALLGVVDDVRGVGAKTKLLCQIAIAVGTYAAGLRIETLSLAGFELPLGVLAQPFTVLWFVGVMNAVNLIDGLDGLAAGLALVALGGSLVLALTGGHTDVVLLAASAIGAILGFLAYNRSPASIFMGDGGSLFLGFLLAGLTVRAASQPSNGSVGMLTPILFVAVPIFDTITAFVRRAAQGGSPFRADRQHVHHRLLRRLGTHRAAVLTLCTFAFALAIVGLQAADDPGPFASAALALVTLSNGALLVWICRPVVAPAETPAPATVPDAGSADIISIETRRQQRPQVKPAETSPTLLGSDSLHDSWPGSHGGLSATPGRVRSPGGARR